MAYGDRRKAHMRDQTREYKQKRRREYKQKRRRRKRAWINLRKRLNVDVMFEIFRHFIDIQDDGQFILTLVSTEWRDLVLRSPILWRRIIIDENSPDWYEKGWLCMAFSRTLPLEIVVRLPITSWEPVITFFPQCGNLFIQIPNEMTSTELGQITEDLLDFNKLPDTCGIHWGRVGATPMPKERREPTSIYMPDVVRLDLTAEGYATSSSGYASNAQSHPNDYQPLVFLKIYGVLEILLGAPNLHTLVLSHTMIDPTSSEIELPVVTMPQLRELKILSINVRQSGIILPLLESIKAPSLSVLSMDGIDVDVIRATRSLSFLGRPSTLNLELSTHGEVEAGHYHNFEAELQWSMRHISSLCLDMQGLIFYGQGDHPRRSIEVVNVLLHLLSDVISARLLLPWAFGSGGLGEKIECIHHPPHSEPGAGCYQICDSADGLISFPDSNKLEVLDMEYGHFGTTKPCRVVSGVRFSSLTTLLCTPFVLLTFLSQHPIPTLHTIQLHWPRVYPFYGNFFQDPDLLTGKSYWSSKYTYPPFSLYPYRPYSDPNNPNSEMRGLEAELEYFDEAITSWFINHASIFPRFRTFGISWFPKWEPLIAMLYVLSRLLKPTEHFNLKLPAYPHPAIQRAISLALGGAELEVRVDLLVRTPFDSYHQSIWDTYFPSWHARSFARRYGRLRYPLPTTQEHSMTEPEDNTAPTPKGKPCYYCECCGRHCTVENGKFYYAHCDSHSQSDLVTLTKDTFVDVDLVRTVIYSTLPIYHHSKDVTPG